MSTQQPVLGVNAKASHIEAAKATLLTAGEILLGAFRGQTVRDGKVVGTLATQYLVVTNMRVVFWGRGLVSNTTDAFPFRDISSVDAHRGMMMGDIVLNIRGAKEKFQSMSKADVDVAAKMIRELIEQAATLTAAPVTSDPIQAMTKLKGMLEGGMITQAEFDTKKAEILSRM